MNSAADRFWSNVTRLSDSECWTWTGTSDRKGYGRFNAYKPAILAHRYAYELVIGAIPDGLQLDHLCRTRSCVNPYHLEPVTNAENTRRGDAGKATGARNRAKTHCRRGHAYDDTNTYVLRGIRYCRECIRVFNRNKRRAARAREVQSAQD